MGEPKTSAAVPRLTGGVDVRSLPIDPFEGFMLSRIDGLLTAQEVADSTGAEVSQVIALIDRLTELGAAVWVTEAQGGTPSESNGSRRPPPRVNAPRIHTRPPPPGTSLVLYDPAELDEDVDLTLERKREILDRYYRLDELDYYQLLSVPRNAEKKEIRSAYFALSKVFHPDTLFGKELGSYKQKMELVFGALTKAYEVLGKKRNRTDYDLYLGMSDTTPEAERRDTDPAPEVAAEVAAEVEEKLEASPAEVLPLAETEPAPPKTPRPPPKPRSADERKSRARARLKHRFVRGPESSNPPEPSPVVAPVERTREDLLRGLAGSLRSAARITGGVDKAAEHLQAGKEAEERGEHLEATNAYRIALSIEDTPETQALYEHARTLLAADLADKYIKHAKYEEANQKWGAAALSWKKVCDGRPNSAEPLYRAANAILMSGGDLKHARDLAQSAVDLMPRSKKPRVILARIYIGAGMQKSALSELREAAKLDPSDQIVKTLLRDLE